MITIGVSKALLWLDFNFSIHTEAKYVFVSLNSDENRPISVDSSPYFFHKIWPTLLFMWRCVNCWSYSRVCSIFLHRHPLWLMKETPCGFCFAIWRRLVVTISSSCEESARTIRASGFWKSIEWFFQRNELLSSFDMYEMCIWWFLKKKENYLCLDKNKIVLPYPVPIFQSY